MQSEKEKLKSDITKVLDKKVKPAILPFAAENDADPQGTNYPNSNVQMNEENDERMNWRIQLYNL